MANRYKKNMDTLCKEKPFGNLIGEFLEFETKKEEQCKVIEGIPCFLENGNYYRIHSQNQIEEANLMMEGLEDTKDYFLVVFGIGNTVLLRELIKNTSDGTRILVIEKNPYVLKYVFSHLDITDLIKSNKLVLSCGEDKILEYTLVACMGAGWENLTQNLKVISMANYGIYENFRKDTIKKITKSILMEINSLGNSLEDVMNGLYSCYQNVDACIFSNGIKELENQFQGVPGIVVSAGPSLDKNLELLKQAEGKAVIITTDAAYRACERVGVKPDAIASVERDKPTYDYFYKDKVFDPNMVLVGPTLLWPDIMKEYPGKKLLMSKTISGTDGWWGDFFESIEHVSMGFSCSNVAHAVLDRMGCNPIIVIGQDFAYTGNKRHSEDSKYYENNELYENEAYNMWVEDIEGEKVKTSEAFNLFRHSMEDQILVSNATFVDATEGGAKIKGSKIMTFQEAIDTYCITEKKKTMNDCLEEKVFDVDKAKKKYLEILAGVEEILQDLDDVESAVAEHCGRINQYEDFDFEHATQEELVDIVLEMQKGNSIINFIISEKKNLVTFYQQNLKQTIIYVKKIGNEVTPETVKRNWELQENLMYLIELATKLVRVKYKEVYQFIEEKLKKAEEK